MTICRIVIAIFAVLYLLSLLALAVGTWGWFGVEPDPLAGVYLVLLGMPWNGILDRFGPSARVPLAIVAPAINLLILVAICRLRR